MDKGRRDAMVEGLRVARVHRVAGLLSLILHPYQVLLIGCASVLKVTWLKFSVCGGANSK